MQTTFALTAPVSVGGISSPLSVAALQLTGVGLTTKPSVAPVGTGVLVLTLTDPVSGWQETVQYADDTVITLWQQIGDAVAAAVFAKLTADGKIPAGVVTADAAPAAPPLLSTPATGATGSGS